MKNWKGISDMLGTRNPVQCLHRWTKILQPGLIKGPWTMEEDKKLHEWVQMEGPKKWSMCSDFITGRSGKQCRERWFNTLNPNVKKGNWSIEEDYFIFSFISENGSKWSKIAAQFEGRTENSIKNRFYSTLRRIHAEKKKNGKFITEPPQSVSLDELIKFVPDALKEKKEKFFKRKRRRCCPPKIDLDKFVVDESPNFNDEKLLNKKRAANKKYFEHKKTIKKNINNTFNINLNINDNNNSEKLIKTTIVNQNPPQVVEIPQNQTVKDNQSNFISGNKDYIDNIYNMQSPAPVNFYDFLVNHSNTHQKSMLKLMSQLNELGTLLNNTKSELLRFEAIKSLFPMVMPMNYFNQNINPYLNFK